MPELPEVEVTRQGVEQAVLGQRVRVLRMGKSLRWPLGVSPQTVEGQRIVGLRRRGKYLLMDLEHGLLLWHLGMSGSLQIGANLGGRGVHDHVEMVCDTMTVRLHDPRRFGALVFARNEADPVASKLLAKLGVEPLTDDFNTGDFYAALRGRKVAIKPLLLSGELVVGVGNIYASEALFHAGIHPARAAGRIAKARVDRLVQAIKRVLTRAIAAGGSSLKDFRHADGELGYFQLETRVYERAGEPCMACGQTVRRMVQGQRATYYCAQCQK